MEERERVSDALGCQGCYPHMGSSGVGEEWRYDPLFGHSACNTGWQLGTAESIAIVMLVGYSLDYVLYISRSYIESPAPSRHERTRDALTHLGVSVWAGMVSNVLAAVFLWACSFLFFRTFAFLIGEYIPSWLLGGGRDISTWTNI